MAELVENPNEFDEDNYGRAYDAMTNSMATVIDVMWESGAHLSNIEEAMTAAFENSDLGDESLVVKIEVRR